MSKTGKTIFSILGLLAGFILLTQLVLFFFGGALFGDRLKNKVTSASGGHYKFEMDRMKINLLGNNFKLFDARLVPIADSLGEKTSALELKVEKLRAGRLFDLVFSTSPVLDLKAINPTINWLNPMGEKPSFLAGSNRDSSGLNIKNLILEDGQMHFINGMANVDTVFSADSFQVNIRGLYRKLDSVSLKSGHASLQNIVMHSSDFNYLTVDSLGFSASDSTLVVNQFKRIPKFSKEQYARARGKQSDYMSIDMEQGLLSGLDVTLLVGAGQLRATHGQLTNVTFDIYRDKEVAYDKSERTLFPQDLLQSIPLKLAIGQIDLEDWQLKYSEKLAENDEPGILNFTELEGSCSNFTNLFGPDSAMVVKVSCRFNGVSNIDARFNVPLVNNSEHVYFYANLTPFQLRDIRGTVSRLSNVGIRSGKLNELIINGHTDGTVSDGRVEFLYDNLRISLQSKQDGLGSLFSGFKESFAQMLLKNNNPAEGKEARTGQISHRRIRYKSIWNHMWKSAYSGLADIMGVPFKQGDPEG